MSHNVLIREGQPNSDANQDVYTIPTLLDADAGIIYGVRQGEWTVEAWEQLDHSRGRFEIIDGVLYQSHAYGGAVTTGAQVIRLNGAEPDYSRYTIPDDEVGIVYGVKQGAWTAADWEMLDHERGLRYEIIDGVLYVSKSPSVLHQFVLMRLYDQLGYPTFAAQTATVFMAPIGFVLPGEPGIQPDFVIVLPSRAHIIRECGIFGVPDAIVEVLSPGNREFDTDVKFRRYAAAGVPEYSIISLAERSVTLYPLIAHSQYGAPRIFHEGDVFAFQCLPAYSVQVARLFAGAPDTTL